MLHLREMLMYPQTHPLPGAQLEPGSTSLPLGKPLKSMGYIGTFLLGVNSLDRHGGAVARPTPALWFLARRM